MANDFRSARFWARRNDSARAASGSRAIDATMGNGGDTLALCELVGETGAFTAFDVQEAAIESTRARLQSAGMLDRATLIHAGHERISEFISEPADAIVFNLGCWPARSTESPRAWKRRCRRVDQALEALRAGRRNDDLPYPGHGRRRRASATR